MRALLATVLIAVLAGCSFGEEGGDSRATFQSADLRRLVLQQEDLPRVFTRFDEGPQITADTPGGSRSDPQRFGRVEGWKARYRRGGSAQTKGPLVIESRADVFESADGAEDELEAHRDDADGTYELLDSPGLGDESFAGMLGQGPQGVRYYLIAWRADNLTASVLVSGFARNLTLSDAVQLARVQQRRILGASA